MLTIKLKLHYLRISLFVNKVLTLFLSLCSRALKNKNKIYAASLIIVCGMLQSFIFDKFPKLKEIFISSIYKIPDSWSIAILSLLILIVGFLVLIIICLLFYIIINSKHIGFTAANSTNASLSTIDLLISKDKIELALDKLSTLVKLKDENLSNEILLLQNTLFRYNRDRLNGILPEKDYAISKSKIVSRAIEIVDEIKFMLNIL